MTTFLAGQILTAQQLQDLEELAVPSYVRKVLDESVTSSTTMQTDNELALAMTANAVYTLAGLLFVTGPDTVDFQMDWTFPTGSTLNYTGAGAHNSAVTGVASGGPGEWIARANQTTSPSTVTPYGTSGVVMSIHLNGLIEVGATAGTLQLRWAQGNVNATPVTVKAGSWMRLERMA